MKRPSDNAIHEAGHAVMIHLTRLGWVNKIVVGERGRGYTIHRIPVKNKPDPILLTIILLAGREAENLWCGAKRGWYPTTDLKAMQRLGVTERGVAVLLKDVRSCLRKWKKSVWAVVAALDSSGRGVVWRGQFERIMRETGYVRPAK